MQKIFQGNFFGHNHERGAKHFKFLCPIDISSNPGCTMLLEALGKLFNLLNSSSPHLHVG